MLGRVLTSALKLALTIPTMIMLAIIVISIGTIQAPVLYFLERRKHRRQTSPAVPGGASAEPVRIVALRRAA